MPECTEVFLCEAVCLFPWLVKICARRIGARQVTKVRRAILGGSITGTKDLTVLTFAAVNCHNCSRCVFFAMIGDVHTDIGL